MLRLLRMAACLIPAFCLSARAAAVVSDDPPALRLWGVGCDGNSKLNETIKAQLQQLSQPVELRPGNIQALNCAPEVCASAWPGTQSSPGLLGGSLMTLGDGQRRAQLWLYRPGQPPAKRILYREVLAMERELPYELAQAAAALVFQGSGKSEPGTLPAECTPAPPTNNVGALPFQPLIHVTFYRRSSQRPITQKVWEKLQKRIPELGGEAHLDQVYELPRSAYGFDSGSCDPEPGKLKLKARSEGRLLEVEFVQGSDAHTDRRTADQKLWEVRICRIRGGRGEAHPVPMATFALSPASAPDQILNALDKQVRKLIFEPTGDDGRERLDSVLCQPFKPALCTATLVADCSVDPTLPGCRESYCPQHPDDRRCPPAGLDCIGDPELAGCHEFFCQKFPDDTSCKVSSGPVCGVKGGPACPKTMSPHVRRLWHASGYLGATLSAVTLGLAIWQFSIQGQAVGGDMACATTDGTALVGRCVQNTSLSSSLIFAGSMVTLGLTIPAFVSYYRDRSGNQTKKQ